MLGRTPARKRNRVIRKIIFRSLLVIGLLGLFGALGFYIFFIKSHKPLYISPISIKNFSMDSKNDDLTSIKIALKQTNIDFDDVIASSSSYTVRLKDGGIVIFSAQKSITSQISSLQFIHSRLTMEGRSFKRLDLRFDKPVINK